METAQNCAEAEENAGKRRKLDLRYNFKSNAVIFFTLTSCESGLNYSLIECVVLSQ